MNLCEALLCSYKVGKSGGQACLRDDIHVPVDSGRHHGELLRFKSQPFAPCLQSFVLCGCLLRGG